ncbi:sugar transporter-like protein [Fusarium oxysporum]|nr:sugar transporter-like protein [Fusarium oxysporum]
MNTATIPVWQSEISRPENRGKLVNLEGSVIAIGTFVAYWIDFGLSYVNSSVQWRFPVAFQIVLAAGLLGGILFMPESPRWLLAHGKKEQAHIVLGALNDLDPNDDHVLAESTVITDAINRFSRSQLGFKELMSGGKNQHFARMVIGSSTQFFQQFTGCNAAIYYSTVLFEETIFVGDRRLSLVMGGVFASNAKGAAVGIFLFITFFAFTILPLPWIYPPEINPLRTRTVASAVSTCTNWLTNFAVVMFTPIFINDAQWGCYLFFACLNYAFIPVIFWFYPETAGRSLEEIDIIFAKAYTDGRPPWRVAATMPHLSLKEQEEQGMQLGLYDNEAEKQKFEQTENLMSSSSSAKLPEEGSNVNENENENTNEKDQTPKPTDV